MFCTFTPDCRCDKSFIKLIGNVRFPDTMCSGMFCVQNKTFQSLEKSDYQRPQWESKCQVRNIPCEEQTNWWFFDVKARGLDY